MDLKSRNIHPHELEEVISMVSDEFSYPNGEKISRDFPLLFSMSNHKHLWVHASEEDTTSNIYSHSGSFFTQMYIDGFSLPVGGIGGVVARKNKQGKGLATDLVEKCIQDLRKQGAALAFLWTGNFDFYRRLGFDLVGRQWFIHLLKERRYLLLRMAKKLAEEQGKSLEDWTILDSFEAKRCVMKEGKALLDQHSLRVERDLEQFSKLLSLPKSRVLGSQYRGNLDAYLVIDKGIDLKDHIHEWAGDTVPLLLLMAKALEEGSLTFISPQFTLEEAPILYELEKNGFLAQAGYMSMVKLLDFSAIEKLIYQKIEGMKLSKEDFSLEKKEGRYWIGNELNLSESDFLKLIFGPELPSTYFQCEKELQNYLDALFPLRLWWWGLDSV